MAYSSLGTNFPQQANTNMFDGVRGIGQPTGYYVQYPEGHYNSVLLQNKPYIPPPQTTPSFHPNEIAQPITDPESYIRKVGSTPGTLDRIKRIVAKQTTFYGLDFSSIQLTWKKYKMLPFQSGWMQIFCTESITGPLPVNMSIALGEFYNQQKACVLQLRY